MTNTYFVTCTFDLKNGSREDYQNAYADLAVIGFSTSVIGDNGAKVVLPTTTTAGKFTGSDAASVRDALVKKVEGAFAARGFTYEIFVSVGGDWAWGHRTNKKEGK